MFNFYWQNNKLRKYTFSSKSVPLELEAEIRGLPAQNLFMEIKDTNFLKTEVYLHRKVYTSADSTA